MGSVPGFAGVQTIFATLGVDNVTAGPLPNEAIFASGFESGDTNGWSSEVP